MSERTADARAALAALGLDPDALAAGDAAAIDALVATLTGPDGARLAEALGALADPGIAAQLVAVEARIAGPARRALRRALYRLRQRGVAVPEPQAPPMPPTARAVGPEPEAALTPFAGDGDRLLWLVKPLADGGSLVVSAHVHEVRGMVELTSAELTRKRLREVRQRLEHDSGLRLVAADWRVVDALLVEAEERSGSAEPRRNYRRLRARITVEPPRPPAEPTSARATPAPPDEAPALVAASAALLAEPELRSWMPAPATLVPYVEEVTSARDSPLVLSRAAQEDRLREVIRRAVAELAPADRLARRLEATAYVFAESARPALARQALAVAAALRAHPREVADVPLAIAYVERPLAQMLAETSARREDAQRGSLVVTPGQFVRDRSSSHPPRTRG